MLLMMSYSLSAASWWRALPFIFCSISILHGGIIVSVTFGNRRRLPLLAAGDHTEYWLPSMCTGNTTAPDLSAIMPGASYIFINAPVLLILPSGNTMHFLPCPISFTTASTVAVSLGSKCILAKGLRYHLPAVLLSIASTGVCGKYSASNKPSRGDRWLATISAPPVVCVSLSAPFSLTRNKKPQSSFSNILSIVIPLLPYGQSIAQHLSCLLPGYIMSILIYICFSSVFIKA